MAITPGLIELRELLDTLFGKATSVDEETSVAKTGPSYSRGGPRRSSWSARRRPGAPGGGGGSARPSVDAANFEYYAEYRAEDGTLVCLCGVDLTLGACMGSALSLLPIAAVKECLRIKALHPSVEENLHEIFNICGSLLDYGGGRVVFKEMYSKTKPAPPDVQAALKKVGTAKKLKIGIPGYGDGLMTWKIV